MRFHVKEHLQKQAPLREMLHQDIDNLLLQAKSVMEDEIDTIAARIFEAKKLYEKADLWASKTDYDKEKYSELLFVYAEFLRIYGLYRDSEAVYLRQIKLAEELYGTEHENIAASYNNIGLLLQRHCIDDQLYLQHNLSLVQLSKAIGTNRTYLSQYFSNQDITYNAYINNLRINHFIILYRKAVVDLRFFTAQELALESGFRSYRTFSEAFKRQTGQTVTAWMKAEKEKRRKS